MFSVFKGGSSIEPVKFQTVEDIHANRHDFFRVVSDVENYDKFIPWCTKSAVNEASRKEAKPGDGEFDATLSIGYGKLEFEYTSHVIYKSPDTIISVSKGGPFFNELYSKWNIQEVTYKTTKVNYEVEMTFSNPLYASLMKYFFNNLVTNINDAF